MFLDFFKHVEWDKRKDESGQVTHHLTKTARIYCESCGVGWSEGDRLRALQSVQWHQTKPFDCCDSRHVPLDDYDRAWRSNDGAEAVASVWAWWASNRHAVHRATCPDCGELGIDNEHAGFQAGKMYSPWQKDKPADIAAKYIAAKDDEDKKQVWWNTQQGMPYRRHSGKTVSVDVLSSRAEQWASEVPDGVAVLTAGLDTQPDRVECEVVGWGRDEESWSVAYEVFEGDPETNELWAQVDAYLKRVFHRADGRPFEIMAACIDSGGHNTQKVYEFAKARLGRRIWAIKGESARNGQRSPVWPAKKPTRKNKASFRPVILGVNAAKDTIHARLQKEIAGPGYMHFPDDRDINYYAQLTSERIVVKEVAGHKFRVWELPSGKANEALDCRVYAYSALCGLLHFGLKLNVRASSAAIQMDPVEVQVAAQTKEGVTTSPEVTPVRKSLASRLS